MGALVSSIEPGSPGLTKKLVDERKNPLSSEITINVVEVKSAGNQSVQLKCKGNNLDKMDWFGKSADFANKNQDFRQKTGGSSNGLKMILNIQQDYYTDAVREEEDHSDLPFANSIAGVKVFIHDKNELLPMYESGIDVGPGSHASIGMVKNEFTNMWKPWGDCDYKQSVMEDGSFEDIFTINTCLQICYSAFINRIKNRESM